MAGPIHIAVTGAAGRIRVMPLLFRIAAGGMFGVDQPVALSLLEIPEAMPLLDATMMELDDFAFPLLRWVRTSTDAARAFADADWVILVGGGARRAGMSRTEALLANGPIIQARLAGDQRVGQGRAGPRRGQPVQHQLPDRSSDGP